MFKMKVTRLFFDSPKVMRAVNRAARQALSKAGAFVRRSARSSIRKRKRVSEPGKPPSSHTGRLRKFLFFVYEQHTQSVIVGPAKLNGTRSDTALQALEHGGATTILRREKGRLVRKRIRVKARPFMQPALDVNLEHIPKQWRGRVRGS